MAWNDGSRFLVAHGVKWGTGPKFYKGSKHDTYWNKDLLWKLYVQGEAKKHGVAVRTEENRNNLEVMPPFMKSLEAARRFDGTHVPFEDPYRNDLFKTNTKSARIRPVIDRTRQDGGMNLETNRSRRPPMRHPSAPSGRGGGRPGSSTSLRSAGAGIGSPSVRGNGTSARVTSRTAHRLASLERMIAEEGQRRRQLENQLVQERRARERTEAQMSQLRSQMNKGGPAGGAHDAKLRAYDTIMHGLVDALKNKQR